MLLNIFAIDDDEVASELMLHLFLMAYGCFLFTVIPRNPSVFEQRLMWGSYADKHSRKETFQRRLRMKKDSFDKLLVMIRDDLVVNDGTAR